VIRWVTRALAIVVFVLAALVVLDFSELLVPVEPDDSASMADTIPACDGRVLAQGFSYKLFSDPEPGHVVAVHAAVTDEGEVIPDQDADDRTLVLRVVAGPGQRIVGRAGTVFVDDVKFDDIETEPFGPITVPNEQYFLLGDNRSAAVDSRTFGPVLGDAIFARVFAVYWPARDITFRLDQGEGVPPGEIDCDA
jgi:signal peptidase I